MYGKESPFNSNLAKKFCSFVRYVLVVVIICFLIVIQINAQTPDVQISLKQSGSADGNILVQLFPSDHEEFPNKAVRQIFTDIDGNEWPNVPTNLGQCYFWHYLTTYEWWPRPTLAFEIHACDKNDIIPSSRIKILKYILNKSTVAWDAQYQVVSTWTDQVWGVVLNDEDTYPMCGVGTTDRQIVLDAPGEKMYLYLQTPEVCYTRTRYTFWVVAYDIQEQQNLASTILEFQIHTYWNYNLGYAVCDAARTYATMGPTVGWTYAEIMQDVTYP